MLPNRVEFCPFALHTHGLLMGTVPNSVKIKIRTGNSKRTK